MYIFATFNEAIFVQFCQIENLSRTLSCFLSLSSPLSPFQTIYHFTSTEDGHPGVYIILSSRTPILYCLHAFDIPRDCTCQATAASPGPPRHLRARNLNVKQIRNPDAVQGADSEMHRYNFVFLCRARSPVCLFERNAPSEQADEEVNSL